MFRAIPISKIRPMNPDFRDRGTPAYRERRDNLAASIRKEGIKNPLWVRELDDGTFQLLAGGTRFEAACLIGLQEVPARVITGEMTEGQQLMEQLQENYQRADFNDFELADLLIKIMESNKWTATELCKNMPDLKLSRVSKLFDMKKVCPEVQELARQGKLRMRVVSALSKVKVEKQKELAADFLSGKYSVEGIENHVRNQDKEKKERLWVLSVGKARVVIRGDVGAAIDALMARLKEERRKFGG